MKVLVADDDRDLVDVLRYGLGRYGYTIVPAVDGLQAIRRWESENPEIIILDINLPKLSGFEVCKQIREQSTTPVIVLSGRVDEQDILRAFRLGADDYVVKPFSYKQLQARMEAVLRRAGRNPYEQQLTELRVGDITLDPRTHGVTRCGEEIRLTPTEFRILYMLALNAGRLVPYARVVEYAWGYGGERDSALLKTHVTHIRDKLGLRNGSGVRIDTRPGVGYALVLAGSGRAVVLQTQ